MKHEIVGPFLLAMLGHLPLCTIQYLHTIVSIEINNLHYYLITINI